MKKKINIGYIGFSPRIVQDILKSEIFDLSCILCEKKGERQDGRRQALFQIASHTKIPYYEFENNSELSQIIRDRKNIVEQYLIYECNTIIREEIINSVSIYNLHPGDLRTNRGCNPIHWSILEGIGSTCMSLYKITPKIDLGIVVAVFPVNISQEDTYSSLKERLESGVCTLLTKLYQYIKGELLDCEVIREGIYKRKICSSDYTLDLSKDSLMQISAKIRSQSAYEGAVLNINETTYRVNAVYADANAAKGQHFVGREEILAIPTKQGTVYVSATKRGG